MRAAVALTGVVVLASSPAEASSLTDVAGNGGGWGRAEEIPGLAALNVDGVAQFNSVSCGSAGNCSGGGSYLDSSVFTQAYVVSQVHGVWGRAEEVPGTAALNQGGGAEVTSVSCAAGGSCSAGGEYTDSLGNEQAYVVSQVHGVWGKAEEVPGTAAFNKGGQASVVSVSCGSAGNCSAAGSFAYYYDGMGDWFTQAFVVSQVNGVWGKAEVVPGLAAVNKGGFAEVDSVSCASAGNCSAAGAYATRSTCTRQQCFVQTFVVSQVDGRWGKEEEVPGTAALNKGGDAGVSQVSCGSAGNCSAGGQYAEKLTRNGPYEQAFVVSQVNGRWGNAEVVPGAAALHKGGAGDVSSLSCGSAGNCTAIGYTGTPKQGQAFVDNQVNGRWGKAMKAPNAGISPLSCASAGNCTAGGSNTDRFGKTQAFVDSQVNGRWGQGEEVPGIAALNKGGYAVIWSVSCASVSHCSAGGTYSPNSRSEQAFVVSQTPATRLSGGTVSQSRPRPRDRNRLIWSQVVTN